MAFHLLIYLFSLFISNQPKVTVISSLRPNEKILYAEADNYIKVEGMNSASLRLTLSHGKSHKVEENKYLIGIHSLKPVTIGIYQGKKLVGKEVFQIHSLPKPIARVGVLKDSVATINQILANPFLGVDLPGCHYKHQFYITSFSLSCVTSNKDTTSTLNVYSHFFSAEQKGAIKTLQAGEQVYFFDIRALCPSCGGLTLPPFKIYVK